ncbi:hypothetical protein HDV05_007422 [Chytridiales sp. JEL 0842]|nr:hypothetical protein HDV05_007422 [Chytridiales sp. JEL 0842]
MLVTTYFATLVLLALTATTTTAFPRHQRRDYTLQPGQYAEPLSTDFRSPCPGLNIIANYGVVPRSGRGLTMNNVPQAFETLLNVAPPVSIRLLTAALAADNDPVNNFGVRTPSSPEGILNLNDTIKHGRVEHDGSLSRPDFPALPQDKANIDLVRDVVTRAVDCKTFTLRDMARLRVDRFNYAQKNTPGFTYGPKEDFLAYSEAALLLTVLGDEEGNVPVEFLLDFFLRDKLAEGWSKPAKPITTERIQEVVGRLKNETNYLDLGAEVPRCTSINIE